MFKCACLSMLLASACTFDSSNLVGGDGGIADAAFVVDASTIDGARGFDAQAPDATPKGCTGMLATFEKGLDLGSYPEVGVYAGLDFEDTWTAYEAGDFNAVSASVSFSSDRPSGQFAFEAEERILRGLQVAWSGFDVTVTISDPDNQANQDLVVSLDEITKSADITTNWTAPSSRIFVASTETWQFFLDEICHTSP